MSGTLKDRQDYMGGKLKEEEDEEKKEPKKA